MNKNLNRKCIFLKTTLLTVTAAALCQVCLITQLRAGDAQSAAKSTSSLLNSENENLPNAVVLSIHGKCEYSVDGVHFIELDSTHVMVLGVSVTSGAKIPTRVKSQFTLNEGAVVRTAKDSRVDIFFRRIGTTVRLQEDTEIKLEKMSRSTRDGVPTFATLLDLRKGRIFTAVRSLVAGSVFEIRNAAGRSVVESVPAGGMGRYIITADGTQVAHDTSVIPLKLIGDKGITVIVPGQKYNAKEGKMLALETPEKVLTLIEFDELHAIAEALE